MEQPKMRCCVKELDLTLQPRIAPRYKSWLPLATQQLRLRNLIQIVGYQLKINNKREKCWFYYTMHRTSMSSPLYTSEPIDNSSPRWASLEVPTLQGTGHSNASEIIIRLWKRTVKEDLSSDITEFTWGISFTGLTYIGSKLSNNLETFLHENSLVFHFHGGFFAPPFCLVTNPDSKRFLVMGVNSFEVKDSYTVNKLSSLRSKMQALKQQIDSVQNLRERIASGESLIVPKYPQSSLNRLFQPKKVSREKKAEIVRIRKDLEVAKFRTKLLEQERVRKMGEIRMLNQCHSDLMEENQDHGSNLMNRYRELNKDIERLYEWRQNHIDSRETYIQTTARLAHRRRQLITELSFIYPINQQQDDRFTINDVHLPDSEKLDGSNDTQVAVALGFVAHTTQMIANILNVPTRYPIIHYGSRSKIIDHVTGNLPDPDRQFPLFARSKDKLQFHYAVYLLNKNIAQLRWYCGLPTADLRATLPNLSGLINVKQSHTLDSSKRTFSGSSLDVDIGNNKSNISLTPPIHKVLFEKFHRTTRSISHFKGTKSLLGSSLDQGLNQPAMNTRLLNNQSKRICKSEESAIDNTVLTLPRNVCNISSDETLNEAIFQKSQDSTSRVPNSCNNFETNNITLIESDIEIMVPMSVSKPRVSPDNNDNLANTRQRSSNSISSCEMALSGSIVDGEDSSNGNSSIKNDECCDGVFTSQENVKRNTDSKGCCANENLSIENEILVGSQGSQRSQRSRNEEFDDTLERNSGVNKADDISHSLEQMNDCDSTSASLKPNSQENLMSREDTMKCDREGSLTAESFQAISKANSRNS
ncbi:PREDICTED: UV radiation resistance-associated gene protein isoform X2 [Ceratosolen solmsi marchali]|uniref:UV radiation resistance-associated gene protein isoform X2 n=1 Tax=Ceratosolen solmsi marchali TaxID=326594 RepID=A0AAJ6YPE0_9HYME|nr:PREDICTED: UV radiation resistance-associated gene protein isoform X2 [Ceratosolen solmsi marchali]